MDIEQDCFRWGDMLYLNQQANRQIPIERSNYMVHWIAIALGVLFVIWQLFYTYMIICSLIENTGRTIFSIIISICHSASPVIFVFEGYQCLLRQIAQHGILKASLGMIICFVVYFFVVSFWNKTVLGDIPEEWKMALLTVAQVLITVVFLYGFIHF